MSLKFKTFTTLADIDAREWNALWPSNYPFAHWEFLYALEQSGCTNASSGWAPHHAGVFKDNELIAVMPLYVKSHSYGEYVFDWAWADAYHRHGLNYYPKLLAGIPFTPCTGPRWAAKDEITEKFLLEKVVKKSSQQPYSGIHVLFPDTTPAVPSLEREKRLGCQFHWLNNNFHSFEEFLDTFNSRKRKSLKKERKNVEQQSFEITALEGVELCEQDWRFFTKLYMRTYFKRSGHAGYLNESFFLSIGKNLAHQIMMVKAHLHGNWVAAALYFYDDNTLYGRYWGAVDEFDGLHFECCYYQGIDYAIKRKFKRFDPGAQGEHKIQRGFTPVFTQSFHHINEAPFAAAISNFLAEEQAQQRSYLESARELLPFKADTTLTSPNVLFEQKSLDQR